MNVKFQMMLAGTATATVTTGTAGCLAKPGRPGRPPRMQAPGHSLAGSAALAPSLDLACQPECRARPEGGRGLPLELDPGPRLGPKRGPQ